MSFSLTQHLWQDGCYFWLSAEANFSCAAKTTLVTLFQFVELMVCLTDG